MRSGDESFNNPWVSHSWGFTLFAFAIALGCYTPRGALKAPSIIGVSFVSFIFKTLRCDENLSINATAVLLAPGLHSAVPIPCWIAKHSRSAFGFGTDSGTAYWKVYLLYMFALMDSETEGKDS